MARTYVFSIGLAVAGCSSGSSGLSPVTDASKSAPGDGESVAPADPSTSMADAGPSDASLSSDPGDAAVDAPADAPDEAEAGSCVTAGTELCDDFESGRIDPTKWTMPAPSSGVTVTLDGQHAHSGRYAVPTPGSSAAPARAARYFMTMTTRRNGPRRSPSGTSP